MTLSPEELHIRRTKWGPRPPEVTPEPIGEGEESVWDYPRPPTVHKEPREIRVIYNDVEIARSSNALKVTETAGAPVYYLPQEDVQMLHLEPSTQTSTCEWKGAAQYFDLNVNGKISQNAAFTYPEPLDDLGMAYSQIAGHISFYLSGVDEARIGTERARPQPGGVYSGWLTSWIKGPVKGAPGTEHW